MCANSNRLKEVEVAQRKEVEEEEEEEKLRQKVLAVHHKDDEASSNLQDDLRTMIVSWFKRPVVTARCHPKKKSSSGIMIR